MKPLTKGTASEGSLSRDRTRQLSGYIVSREERSSVQMGPENKLPFRNSFVKIPAMNRNALGIRNH